MEDLTDSCGGGGQQLILTFFTPLIFGLREKGRGIDAKRGKKIDECGHAADFSLYKQECLLFDSSRAHTVEVDTKCGVARRIISPAADTEKQDHFSYRQRCGAGSRRSRGGGRGRRGRRPVVVAGGGRGAVVVLRGSRGGRGCGVVVVGGRRLVVRVGVPMGVSRQHGGGALK